MTSFVLPTTFAITGEARDWLDSKTSLQCSRSMIIRYVIWKHILDPPDREEIERAYDTGGMHYHTSFRLDEEMDRRMKRQAKYLGINQTRLFRVYMEREMSGMTAGRR